MKAESIKAIFTNLLFVIGVILLIFGFIQGALTATRLVVFDQYPLNSYEETRCELEANFSQVREPVMGEISTPSAEEVAQRQATCIDSLARQRQVRLTEHVVTSLTTLVAGGTLVWSFKRFIFG